MSCHSCACRTIISNNNSHANNIVIKRKQQGLQYVVYTCFVHVGVVHSLPITLFPTSLGKAITGRMSLPTMCHWDTTGYCFFFLHLQLSTRLSIHTMYSHVHNMCTKYSLSPFCHCQLSLSTVHPSKHSYHTIFMF